MQKDEGRDKAWMAMDVFKAYKTPLNAARYLKTRAAWKYGDWPGNECTSRAVKMVVNAYLSLTAEASTEAKKES